MRSHAQACTGLHESVEAVMSIDLGSRKGKPESLVPNVKLVKHGKKTFAERKIRVQLHHVLLSISDDMKLLGSEIQGDRFTLPRMEMLNSLRTACFVKPGFNCINNIEVKLLLTKEQFETVLECKTVLALHEANVKHDKAQKALEEAQARLEEAKADITRFKTVMKAQKSLVAQSHEHRSVSWKPTSL